jgi:hypothetical protein
MSKVMLALSALKVSQFLCGGSHGRRYCYVSDSLRGAVIDFAASNNRGHIFRQKLIHEIINVKTSTLSISDKLLVFSSTGRKLDQIVDEVCVMVNLLAEIKPEIEGHCLWLAAQLSKGIKCEHGGLVSTLLFVIYGMEIEPTVYDVTPDSSAARLSGVFFSERAIDDICNAVRFVVGKPAANLLKSSITFYSEEKSNIVIDESKPFMMPPGSADLVIDMLSLSWRDMLKQHTAL